MGRLRLVVDSSENIENLFVADAVRVDRRTSVQAATTAVIGETTASLLDGGGVGEADEGGDLRQAQQAVPVGSSLGGRHGHYLRSAPRRAEGRMGL